MTISGRAKTPQALDDGCDVAPHCLQCPLAVCKFDAPRQRVRAEDEQRRAEALRLLAGGLPVVEVAKRIGASERTVFRIRQMGAR